MAKTTEDDEQQLERTKMSFSEHLEELRAALFKSIAAWLVGTAFGLMIGWQVVDFVQIPLVDALENYYRGQAKETQLKWFEQQNSTGEPVPDDPAAAATEIANEGLMPEDWYIDPHELSKILNSLGIKVPGEKDVDFAIHRDEMLKLRLYRPLEDDPRTQAISTGSQEGFMVYMKASLVVGAMLASPFIFYFLWQFVAAGLYKKERNLVYLYLPMSLGLFFAGAALAFFAVFDYVLDFLFWFNAQMGINPTPRISEWMSFVLILPLGFGISFQLPLVMLMLERVGIFTIKDYLDKWRMAVVVIAVLSMFLTPADPGSMILMGVPLVFLYFGGILLCKYLPKS
ncbi:twin-arginine translocase subunit TatC [Bythopirellula polymerisocia]|uniref:Sec-independent protein translocase protein TatC n=1 Tax=Bythopirellula polymerisocia TaxID=2528003 RepID=A0A5C6C9H9_9BACT|nr:twin-arginine translocase subunit TatC [Bythopirellula polymerisocia]TWU20818.1 Sec-independent protein translocase protein TatCy [Bythopirellula polymerisocia]